MFATTTPSVTRDTVNRPMSSRYFTILVISADDDYAAILKSLESEQQQQQQPQDQQLPVPPLRVIQTGWEDLIVRTHSTGARLRQCPALPVPRQVPVAQRRSGSGPPRRGNH
jgi:hypothetical protein